MGFSGKHPFIQRLKPLVFSDVLDKVLIEEGKIPKTTLKNSVNFSGFS